MATIPDAPAGVVQALAALRGGVSLLSCIDPERWNSLGRPASEDLAALGATISNNLEDALSEVLRLPDA